MDIRIVHWLTRLYDALLRLYPRSFHSEFAEEMREVFAQAAGEACGKSALALGQLCLHELIGLPASIARAHRQARAIRQASGGRLHHANPLEQSWRELLLALTVFLLPAVMILVNRVPSQVPAPAMPRLEFPVVFLFLVVMIVIGRLGGFPLWSLPYVGIVLVIAGYLYLFQWVAALITPSLISNFSAVPMDRSAYLLLEVVSTGMLWLMLFCLTLLVVALLAVFNRFQPLLKRVRHDWTQLSFILYGESVFALLLLFENHRFDVSYTIATLFFLVAGVWFYLRCAARWQRLLALLGGLTLAVGIVALGNWPGTTAGQWTSWSQLRPSEIGRLLLSWIWMVVALLLPGLLSRLPSAPPRTRSPSPPLHPSG